jgi:hypothetical protein
MQKKEKEDKDGRMVWIEIGGGWRIANTAEGGDTGNRNSMLLFLDRQKLNENSHAHHC